MPIDFDQIRTNAATEGIPLSEISIIYQDLTDDELIQLDKSGLFVSGNRRRVLGRFSNDGSVMFADKAVGVYTLAS